MARYKPKHMKKNKPISTRDWTGILISALIDLFIGLLLHIIEKMMD